MAGSQIGNLASAFTKRRRPRAGHVPSRYGKAQVSDQRTDANLGHRAEMALCVQSTRKENLD